MMLKRLFQRRTQSTPERAGAPRAPAGTRIYAIGDIHGCLDHLERLHAAIRADAEDAPGRGLLVYLGDYVDRGPDSRGVIECLAGPAPTGLERIFLKGNHEDFMVQALKDRGVLPSWLANGGDATCRSYGFDPARPPPGCPDPAAWQQDSLRRALPAGHGRFLKALALSHREGDYFFCHAGVRPGVDLAAQSGEDLMWIREPFLSATAPHGKVVVHGHTPVQSPERRANRIGVDTGACYGGSLTALVLEDAEQRFIQVS